MLYRFSLLLYAAVKRIWVLKHSGFRLPVLRATPQSNLIHIFVCEVRGGPPQGTYSCSGARGQSPRTLLPPQAWRRGGICGGEWYSTFTAAETSSVAARSVKRERRPGARATP